MKHYFTESPVIIGGVGGSGTRAVTELLKRGAYFMGNDLNESNDNMQLAHYFPKFRRIIQNKETLFEKVSRFPGKLIKGNKTYKQTYIHNSLCDFEKQMYDDWKDLSLENTSWGWKIPGNFLILDILADHYRGLKYIHTIRHGLDMAFSKNQNQLRNWGDYYGISTHVIALPKVALSYWIKANKKAIQDARDILKNRFLLLNFDRMCINPENEIRKMIEFLGCDDIINHIEIIKKPKTIERYKSEDLSIFSDSEIDEVKQLGFDCEI